MMSLEQTEDCFCLNPQASANDNVKYTIFVTILSLQDSVHTYMSEDKFYATVIANALWHLMDIFIFIYLLNLTPVQTAWIYKAIS